MSDLSSGGGARAHFPEQRLVIEPMSDYDYGFFKHLFLIPLLN